MNDQRLGVRVEADLLKSFDLACGLDRRSRSAGIRVAMAQYVARIVEGKADNGGRPELVPSGHEQRPPEKAGAETRRSAANGSEDSE
jgi:Ribbon-helix-helix protein, copG family